MTSLRGYAVVLRMLEILILFVKKEITKPFLGRSFSDFDIKNRCQVALFAYPALTWIESGYNDFRKRLISMVATGGLEPPTPAL